MKEKKKSDVAVLLDYAGSRKGLTFLGLFFSAVSMLLYLHLAGSAGSDRRRPGLDTSA